MFCILLVLTICHEIIPDISGKQHKILVDLLAWVKNKMVYRRKKRGLELVSCDLELPRFNGEMVGGMRS
jgi:hypothetical protein